MSLRSNTVDRDAVREPLPDLVGHTLGLAVASTIKVVVVDVQLGTGIRRSCGFECDPDEILADDIVEWA